MIKESTQNQIIDEGNPSQFDHQHQRFLQFTKSVIGYLTTNKDIHSYLQKINLSSATLIQEYHEIQTIHQQLSDKYRQHPVVRNSLTRNWNFINGFVRQKDLKKKDSKGKAVWILEVQAKIGCLYQFMMTYREQKTIANSPKEHYEKTWERIKVVEAKDAKKTAKDMKTLKKLMFVGTSAVVTQQEYESNLAKKIVFSLSMPKNFFMSDSAKLYSFPYYRDPQITHAKDLWNMGEYGAMREFSKVFFESIKVNKKIWIPPNGDFSEQTDVFTEKQGHIQVRLLYNGKMKFYKKGREREEASSDVEGCGFRRKKKQVRNIQKILVYIHGGGFIALSSRSTQAFTRHWANQLEVPIFCIDYRMPPQHPFPQPVYDCFVTYQFIMHHISHFMNVDPKEIYVAGDSAGGNLASSMTALLLRHKIPPPLGLYLVFPAMDIRLNISQSVVFTLTDPFLWPGCLRMCLSEYLGNDYQKAKDPLASPALLSEQYVGGAEKDKRFPLQWPRTIMTVGDNDPLMDGVLLAMDRMVESGVDCQCVLYKQLCHGFIALGQVVEECQKTLDDSIVHLRDIMNIAK